MPHIGLYPTREEYNEYFRKYREANRDKIRAYNREYNRKWRKINGYHNKKKSRNRYPEKVKARRILQFAVRMGKMIRGNCEVCGKPKGQVHHDDYSKPLEVKWFCPLHHSQYDKKRNKK